MGEWYSCSFFGDCETSNSACCDCHFPRLSFNGASSHQARTMVHRRTPCCTVYWVLSVGCYFLALCASCGGVGAGNALRWASHMVFPSLHGNSLFQNVNNAHRPTVARLHLYFFDVSLNCHNLLACPLHCVSYPVIIFQVCRCWLWKSMANVHIKLVHAPASLDGSQAAPAATTTTSHQSMSGWTARRKGNGVASKLAWRSNRQQPTGARRSTDAGCAGFTPSPVKILGEPNAKGPGDEGAMCAPEVAGPEAVSKKDTSTDRACPSSLRHRCLSSDPRMPKQRSDWQLVASPLHKRGAGSGMLALVDPDGSVTLTVAEDSPPLRFALCPAFDKANGAEKLGTSTPGNGAQVHELFPVADAEADSRIKVSHCL